MTPLSATAEQPEAPLFTDGLGDRVVAVDAATGDLLQILRVRPQLLAVPSFEFALRERAARLANFRHAYYGRVRRIDRQPAGLAIVSDHVWISTLRCACCGSSSPRSRCCTKMHAMSRMASLAPSG